MQTTVQGTDEKTFVFANPISFIVEVNKEKLTAQLRSAVMKEGFDYFYKITFSDGHSDEYVIQGWKIYNSKDKTDPYCKALEQEIHAVLFSWRESTPLACFQTEIKGEVLNVWVTEVKKSKFYTVYIRNIKQFDIVNTGVEWSFKKTAVGIAVSKPVTEKIKSIIDNF